MKKQLLFSILLTSFLLASCKNITDENSSINDNNTENLENFENNEISLNNNSQNKNVETQRTSYEEYQARLNNNIDNNQISNALLATYSTSLGSSSDERVNNLEIVCDRLNNYILEPGETFSYNEVVGPFGEDDGFKKAPIMMKDGTKKDGYGGGVCQLSSTLYNVVKNIENVNITERHHHSAPVSYVPKGEDATISLQSNLDFKFTNNTNYNIQFKAKCENNEVTVWAYKVIL